MLESVRLQPGLKVADRTAPQSLTPHHPAGYLGQYFRVGIQF